MTAPSLVAAFLLLVSPVAAIWPKPQSITQTSTTLKVASPAAGFKFVGKGAGADPATYGGSMLGDAFGRYYTLAFINPAPSVSSSSSSAQAEAVSVTSLTVDVASPTGSIKELGPDMDESYTLDISSAGASLKANKVFGALRGLETFAQLLDGQAVVNETHITDAPRFGFRASFIDTCRHWYPVSVIKEHIDVMSYAKFNVLHWHIVDSQSFPYVSKAFPQLSATGAWSPTHIYTPQDVQDVINYAAARGIRILPEFDTPGHMDKGYSAIPDLLTTCYDPTTGKPAGTGPANPTLDSTYDFLTKLYAEIKAVFPDKFVHVGGDEVPTTCWQSNPQIQKWLKAHPKIVGFGELEQYYELKLLDILKAQNTSYMCWEEIFDNGVQILPDTVVNVWKGGWNETMAKATKAGYHTVLSAPFYLNYISYGEDWNKYYAVEPTDFECDGGKCDKSLVNGVEQCMWSEFIDSTNFIPRTWPRAAAIAERGWSSKDTTDMTDATQRMHEFRCRLLKLGVRAEPPSGPSFCEVEYDYQYNPVWQKHQQHEDL